MLTNWSKGTLKNLGCLLVLFGAVSLAQGCTQGYDPVDGFAKAIEDRKHVTESEVLIAQVTTEGHWRQDHYKIADVTYDVKKNDSLVNPYVGVVTFTYQIERGEIVATEDLAKSSTKVADVEKFFTATLEYLGSEKGWHLNDGAYFFNAAPQDTYPLNAKRIMSVEGAPFEFLKAWL